jgi:signal transduction histidine kinase
MTTELRQTGIGVLGDLPWGAHFCSFYETKQDLLDILLPYFKTGLENKEFCLWVISNSELLTRQEATSALRSVLPDLDRHLAEGSIEVVEHDDWFLNEGSFDLHRVANRFKDKLDEALARGYAGLRINGSPAWVHDEPGGQLRKFEEECDRLFLNQRIIASCTYPLSTTTVDGIFNVIRTHQFAIARRYGEWEVLETPELIEAKQQLEERVVERTQELAAMNEELRNEIVERRHAEDKLKATSAQLRALMASVTSAREEEGIRIARELHDELGSALTSLKWDLEEMAKVLSDAKLGAELQSMKPTATTMMGLVDGTIDVVRRISAELRPSVLDDLGLVPTIDWQARQFERRTGIVCNFDCSLEKVGLNPQQSTAVFRILQEASTNVLRHAQATRVDITASEQAGEFILTMRDNGRGITEDEKSAPRSLGLLGMRERAILIGGTIDITGVEGKGTVITLRVPIGRAT